MNKVIGLVVGEKYLVRCGWGDTPAILEYIVKMPNGQKTQYHFKSMNGFKFLSNGEEDIY